MDPAFDRLLLGGERAGISAPTLPSSMVTRETFHLFCGHHVSTEQGHYAPKGCK